MDISATVEFAAPPEQVFAMMTDSAFLDEVCTATGALKHTVSATGNKTSTSRTLPAPAAAARFTGPNLVVNETTSWGPASADGSRTASVAMAVPGQPVTMKGTIALAPGGPGSVARLSGELKVSIPLLGRKLEESAAPAILAGFKTQGKVGASWLAG